MKYKSYFLILMALGLFTPLLFSADPVAPPIKPKPVSSTNTQNLLPADHVWLIGEEMKQLVGDWVNQQGDIGVDLLYYLQEPVKILTEEVKRIDLEHQKETAALKKELAELRADIQALKKAQSERVRP